jgi:hypothetical protein
VVQINAWRESVARVIVLVTVAIGSPPSSISSERPGNVFLVGDSVRLAIPPSWAGWRVVDVDHAQVAVGEIGDGWAAIGKLPVGYYEVHEKGGTARVTFAVLAPTAPSDDTPIAVDAAMSWFYSEPAKIRDACRLCRLAGVKWVRDRLSWPEMEPAKGKLAGETRYERSMRIQHEAGLRILQVNHASPPWLSKDASRFPEDLRDAYQFYKSLAKRWHGLVDAIEPWNEPDIKVFGGHTGCEIASFQKASYLGLKAGDATLPVCEAVFAIDRAVTLEEFGLNEVYPYFERYDLHHYIGLPAYPRAYARHRAVSGGRPLWTTEFNLTINWSDEKTKEPSDEDLRIQGYRVAKVFARALHEGAAKAFYFILGDYVERQIQYGLVHQDLTPRPAYVAFAAVGRLFNAAEPIGRIDFGNDKFWGFLFRTVVDGEETETLVAWSETNQTDVAVSGAHKLYDYLGREMLRAEKVRLTKVPVFAVLARGASKSLKVSPSAARAMWIDGRPCPVVLQLLGKSDAPKSAFVLDDKKELRLAIYNFDDHPRSGNLSIKGAQADKTEVTVAPGDVELRTLRVASDGPVTVSLDLGENVRPLVVGNVILSPPMNQGK